MFTPLFCFLFQDENGEVLSPFAAVGASSVSATAQSVRERFGELSSVSSTSSSMSPLPQSPAQAMAYRGREGSFESRYQSPIDDFRVSQETLLDMDVQNRRCVCVWCVSLCGVRCLSRMFWTCRRLQTLSCLCLHFRIPRRTRVENRV